jgi:hypothetical protein
MEHRETDLICSAIKNKQRIEFNYNDKRRVGEPQCCGISEAGNVVVRVHLIQGGSRPEQLFVVSKLRSLKVLNEHFERPGPNYKKNDSAMAEIFCQL